MTNFKQKTAVITGAAGGIGKYLSEFLSIRKCNLVLIDLPQKSLELETLQQRLQKQYCTAIKVLPVDVQNVKEMKEALKILVVESIQIDFLINNVGINILKPALDITEDEWDKVLDTNLKGNFFMTRFIGEQMFQTGGGSIVFIASQHGVVANLDRVAYCSSKAALIHLSKALALEWAQFNIRVNCVSPTFVETDNNKELLSSVKYKRELLKQIPLGTYAKPEDIAYSIEYLLSEKSKCVTGHNLLIDGGWTIK